MRCTIDTNVPIVANGEIDTGGIDKHPSLDCRIAAIEFLMSILSTGQIVIDLAGEIQSEYKRRLNPRGQPGVGDRFYLEVLNSNPERVLRIDLPKNRDGQYLDLPKILIDTNFDPSDRKFAAIAARENIPVINATDSDWINHRTELKMAKIDVRHLCGCETATWFTG